MKKFFFFLALIFCFLSCNNKENYHGQWTNWFYKDYGYNETRSVVIENDSIKFNYTYFDFWNKYPLTIEKGTFKFNDITLNATIEKDTLAFNDSIYFVKDDLDTLYGYKPILKIELPQITNVIENSKKDDDVIIFLYYGKRLDNGKFSLQLNDKYGEISELPSFLHVGCGGSRREEVIPFVTNYLFFDKDSKMKDIEQIFVEMSRINSQKIKLINDIKLKFDDSLGFHYDYESIIKRLHPFQANDNYNPNTSNEVFQAPPPPISFPMFEDTQPDPKVILLKNDTIYFNNKIINPKDIKPLIKPWFENNNALFSLYDLESTYGKFLEMNAIINSAYDEVRETHSKIKFNKTLKDLTRDEYDEVKLKIKMYHIWSYSIPHYNTVIQQENSFFGLNVNKMM